MFCLCIAGRLIAVYRGHQPEAEYAVAIWREEKIVKVPHFMQKHATHRKNFKGSGGGLLQGAVTNFQDFGRLIAGTPQFIEQIPTGGIFCGETQGYTEV